MPEQSFSLRDQLPKLAVSNSAFAGIRQRLLSGCPLHLQSAADRGGQVSSQSSHVLTEKAAVGPIDHENGKLMFAKSEQSFLSERFFCGGSVLSPAAAFWFSRDLCDDEPWTKLAIRCA